MKPSGLETTGKVQSVQLIGGTTKSSGGPYVSEVSERDCKGEGMRRRCIDVPCERVERSVTNSQSESYSG